MNLPLKKILLVGLISSSLTLGGCSAIGTAVKKRNLEVKTQMSETIWLDPATQKTVYLQIRNTSDKAMPQLPDLISKEVKLKGYTVTDNPEKAYYWIQANVLKADKMDLREAQAFLSGGYEGALAGAAMGATAMAYNVNSSGAALGVGLAAGLAGAAIDSMIEDVNYTMITDLQISTASKNAITIKDNARLKQGTSGAVTQSSTEQTHRQKYQTRIVSNANKVNLKYEEAKPELEKQLAQSIANIL